MSSSYKRDGTYSNRTQGQTYTQTNQHAPNSPAQYQYFSNSLYAMKQYHNAMNVVLRTKKKLN